MVKMQESMRKNIERFFGALQGRFNTLRQDRHEWCDTLIILMIQVCVIIHNMIVYMDTYGRLREVDENGKVVDVVNEFEEEVGDEQGAGNGNSQTGQGITKTSVLLSSRN